MIDVIATGLNFFPSQTEKAGLGPALFVRLVRREWFYLFFLGEASTAGEP